MTIIAERASCASVDEVSALLPVVGGTTTVPLVDGTQRVYANLDYAASAPALEAVAARVTEVLPLYASIGPGGSTLARPRGRSGGCCGVVEPDLSAALDGCRDATRDTTMVAKEWTVHPAMRDGPRVPLTSMVFLRNPQTRS